VKSLQEFIASGGLYEPLREGYERDQALEDPLNDPEYRSRLLRREELRQAVMTAIADNQLDAILYPHQKRLVVPIGEDQVERNGVLSNSTGFPAITIQGGFSEPTEAAPIGVPIGIWGLRGASRRLSA
jgi:amidase